MIACLSIESTHNQCAGGGAPFVGGGPRYLMNVVRTKCEVGPARSSRGIACRCVTGRAYTVTVTVTLGCFRVPSRITHITVSASSYHIKTAQPPTMLALSSIQSTAFAGSFAVSIAARNLHHPPAHLLILRTHLRSVLPRRAFCLSTLRAQNAHAMGDCMATHTTILSHIQSYGELTSCCILACRSSRPRPRPPCR